MVGTIYRFGASKMCWYVCTYFIMKSADGYGHNRGLLSALVTVGGLLRIRSSNLNETRGTKYACSEALPSFLSQKSGSVFLCCNGKLGGAWECDWVELSLVPCPDAPPGEKRSGERS